MGYINNILKYTPSSLYGKHKFLYGEKRKLNHWFKYYLFPVYGRYIFLYNPQDNIIIEQPFFLDRTSHNINTVERIIATNKTPINEIDIKQGINLEVPKQKLEIENAFGLHSCNFHFDNSIHNNYYLKHEIENMDLLSASSTLEKKKTIASDIDMSYILTKINVFDLLQDKLFENIRRIDHNIEHFITHALKSKVKDVNIFATDNFTETENRKIVHLSEFILSKIGREMIQENIMSLNAIPRNKIDHSTNNDFQVVVGEISLLMQKDKTLRRVIENMYLYELEIKKLERELYNNQIQQDTVILKLIKEKLMISSKNEKSFFIKGKNKSLIIDTIIKGTKLHTDKISIIKNKKRTIQSNNENNLAIKDNIKKTNKLQNKYDTSKTKISIEKIMQIDTKENIAATISHNNLEINNKKSKDLIQTNNYEKINKNRHTKNITITNTLTMFNEKAKKYIIHSDNSLFINEKVSKNIRTNTNAIKIIDKLFKASKIVNTETFIDHKIFKPIKLITDEYIFDYKVLKLIENEFTKIELSPKILQNITLGNKKDFIVDYKVTKPITLIDNENVFKSVTKEKEGIDINTINIDTPFIKINKKYTKDIILNKKVVDLSTSKVSMLDILNVEKVVNNRSISNYIDFINIKTKFHINYKYTTKNLDIVTNKTNLSNKAQSRKVQNLDENSVLNGKIPNREIHTEEKNSVLSGKIPSRENIIEKSIQLCKSARNTVDNQYFNTDVELKVIPSSGINTSDINGKYLNIGYGHNLDIFQNKELEKNYDNTNVKVKELELLKSEQHKISEEVETRLDMHKRFWFVKSHGKIDYKILPNRDFNYPPDIALFENVINEIYTFNYNTEFLKTKGAYIVETYDENYQKVAEHFIPTISEYDSTINNIKVKIEIKPTGHNSTAVKFDIGIYNLANIQYMIIRQPKDYKGNKVLYTVTEKLFREKHPIPFGNTLGLVEIELHIPIMVDFINILLLMWSKFYIAFTGYTGTKAIYGLVNVVYEWLMLDTSLEQTVIEEYFRCFRWLRWEAEKVSNKAKYDPDLSGNLWVEELIYELIDYMETHHVNKLPEFNPINKMDEYRQLFCDPSFDIPVIVDKYKGVRKRVINKHKQFNNEH